jgi:hypothetical protein
MLVVETVARIRREHIVKGKTIKEIARDLARRTPTSDIAARRLGEIPSQIFRGIRDSESKNH